MDAMFTEVVNPYLARKGDLIVWPKDKGKVKHLHGSTSTFRKLGWSVHSYRNIYQGQMSRSQIMNIITAEPEYDRVFKITASGDRSTHMIATDDPFSIEERGSFIATTAEEWYNTFIAVPFALIDELYTDSNGEVMSAEKAISTEKFLLNYLFDTVYESTSMKARRYVSQPYFYDDLDDDEPLLTATTNLVLEGGSRAKLMSDQSYEKVDQFYNNKDVLSIASKLSGSTVTCQPNDILSEYHNWTADVRNTPTGAISDATTGRLAEVKYLFNIYQNINDNTEKEKALHTSNTSKAFDVMNTEWLKFPNTQYNHGIISFPAKNVFNAMRFGAKIYRPTFSNNPKLLIDMLENSVLNKIHELSKNFKVFLDDVKSGKYDNTLSM